MATDGQAAPGVEPSVGTDGKESLAGQLALLENKRETLRDLRLSLSFDGVPGAEPRLGRLQSEIAATATKVMALAYAGDGDPGYEWVEAVWGLVDRLAWVDVSIIREAISHNGGRPLSQLLTAAQDAGAHHRTDVLAAGFRGLGERDSISAFAVLMRRVELGQTLAVVEILASLYANVADNPDVVAMFDIELSSQLEARGASAELLAGTLHAVNPR